MDYAAIGKRIKKARTDKGYTQEYVANQIGVAPAHISNIERATTKLSLKTFVEICNVLQVSTDEILCGPLDDMSAATDAAFLHLLRDCSVEEKSFLAELSYSALKPLRKFGQ